MGGSLRRRDGGDNQGESPFSSVQAARTPSACLFASASRTIASAADRSIFTAAERNAHWSGCGSHCRSRNTPLPSIRGCCSSGNAIGSPKPPRGNVSWLGKKRSYESKPSSGRRSIVSVSRCAEFAGQGGGHRLGEKQPGLRAVARTRPAHRDGHAAAPAGFPKRLDVLPPIRLVEIGRQEEAGFVRQQRVDADGQRPAAGVLAGEMLINHLVGDGQKSPMRAGCALCLRLVAQALHPLVGTGRPIARAAAAAALEAAGIDVSSRPRNNERNKATLAATGDR